MKMKPALRSMKVQQIGSATTPVGHVTVKADETTHLAVQARAGALAKGSQGQGGQGGEAKGWRRGLFRRISGAQQHSCCGGL